MTETRKVVAMTVEIPQGAPRGRESARGRYVTQASARAYLRGVFDTPSLVAQVGGSCAHFLIGECGRVARHVRLRHDPLTAPPFSNEKPKVLAESAVDDAIDHLTALQAGLHTLMPSAMHLYNASMGLVPTNAEPGVVLLQPAAFAQTINCQLVGLYELCSRHLVVLRKGRLRTDGRSRAREAVFMALWGRCTALGVTLTYSHLVALEIAAGIEKPISLKDSPRLKRTGDGKRKNLLRRREDVWKKCMTKALRNINSLRRAIAKLGSSATEEAIERLLEWETAETVRVLVTLEVAGELVENKSTQPTTWARAPSKPKLLGLAARTAAPPRPYFAPIPLGPAGALDEAVRHDLNFQRLIEKV